VNEQAIAHALYKKLLALYPRKFKEQFAESMEQTFNDLFNEQKRRIEQELFSFVCWMFVETVMGIIKEHGLMITEGNAMKNIFTILRSPAIVSLILVFPFLILELVNRRNFHEGLPVPLFVIMWLFLLLFFLTVMPVVRSVRAGISIVANPIILLLRVVFLAFIAWMWLSLLIDQMPCFLGVPNCD